MPTGGSPGFASGKQTATPPIAAFLSLAKSQIETTLSHHETSSTTAHTSAIHDSAKLGAAGAARLRMPIAEIARSRNRRNGPSIQR